MEARTKHILELGAKCLEIVILPGEEDLGKSQITAQASASYDDVGASPSLRQQEQRDNDGHGATAKEVLTKKVHQEEQCHNLPCL